METGTTKNTISNIANMANMANMAKRAQNVMLEFFYVNNLNISDSLTRNKRQRLVHS